VEVRAARVLRVGLADVRPGGVQLHDLGDVRIHVKTNFANATVVERPPGEHHLRRHLRPLGRRVDETERQFVRRIEDVFRLCAATARRREQRQQPLPAVIDMDEALEGKRVIHPDLGDNICFKRELDTGGVDEAFAKADVVVEELYRPGGIGSRTSLGRAMGAASVLRFRSHQPWTSQPEAGFSGSFRVS